MFETSSPLCFLPLAFLKREAVKNSTEAVSGRKFSEGDATLRYAGYALVETKLHLCHIFQKINTTGSLLTNASLIEIQELLG